MSNNKKKPNTVSVRELRLLNAMVGVKKSSMKVEASMANKELMFMDIKLNGKQAHALMDTGATHNFISTSKEKWPCLTLDKIIS